MIDAPHTPGSTRTRSGSPGKTTGLRQNDDVVLLPADPGLEATVLGSMIVDADAAHEVVATLPPDAIYSDRNRRIFDALRTLVTGGAAVDVVALSAELRRLGQFDAVGGAGYLADLTTSVGSAANVRRHCLILIERWMMRRFIETSTANLGLAREAGADALEVIAQASRDLAMLDESATLQTGGMQPLASTVDAYLESLLGGRPLAVPTGLRAVASLLDGHKRGRFYVYAGRPAMGKSGLALGFARVSARAGFLSAYFSLEMPREEVHDRLLAIESGVGTSDVPHLSYLREDQQAAIRAAAERLKALPLLIDDTPGLSIDDLRTRLWRLSTRAVREGRELGVVVVDYIQLMKGRRERGQARHEEIASITRALKTLAKELNTPIIALSQVPRDVEKRPDKRPTMSDLAESSSIENDADVVAFVYRDEYYKEMRDAEGRSTEGVAEIIVAKQRGGKTGARRVAFIGHRTMFGDLADPYDDRAPDPF